MPTTAKLFTFSLDDSPAELEVLSTNTLFDLVDIGFQVCDPRPGESVDDHLWNITLVNFAAQKFVYCGPVSPEEFFGPDEDPLPDATTTTLADLGNALKEGTKLVLEYDYGSTSKHTFTVRSVETANNPCISDFPRRKREPTIQFEKFVTKEVDLDAEYSALNHWIKGSTEVNLFQPGRTQNYGYLEHDTRMIYLPDKPLSLNHYLECLNVGAGVRKSYGYNWQSVVVLPTGSKKISKYSEDLEEGFVDCKVVADKPKAVDLAAIFPKVAALAGYSKDKNVRKGWIRYKSNTLIIAVGTGGTSTLPQAPKGTAYDGTGYHIPNPSDEILLRSNMKIDSLHQLFCVVEGFLQSL